MDAQHTIHVTYKLGYHFVWCPKYRKKILVGKIATFIEQEIRRICFSRRPRLWLPQISLIN
jgi:putative transposase